MMTDKHVCYSRQLGCSPVSPCRLCFEAQCENVLPIIAQAFALTHQQAAHLRYVFEEAYSQFSQYALHDQQLMAGAIDLRRLVLAPPGEQGHAPMQMGPWGSVPVPQGRPYAAPPGPYAAAPPGPYAAPPGPYAAPPGPYAAPLGPYDTPPGPYDAPPGPYTAPAPPTPTANPYARAAQWPPAASPPQPAPAAPARPQAATPAAWPTRAAARPVAPAPQPPPTALAELPLDEGTLDALASIGDALARGETPELPPGLDVGAILAAFVPPGSDPASLDIGALVSSFAPPGADTSAIVAMVTKLTRGGGGGPPTIDVAGVDVTDVPSVAKPAPAAMRQRAELNTPELRAARREERRRAERAEMMTTSAPAPAPSPAPAAVAKPKPAPVPTELSADDFGSAGTVVEATAHEGAPNGVSKTS